MKGVFKSVQIYITVLTPDVNEKTWDPEFLLFLISCYY